MPVLYNSVNDLPVFPENPPPGFFEEKYYQESWDQSDEVGDNADEDLFTAEDNRSKGDSVGHGFRGRLIEHCVGQHGQEQKSKACGCPLKSCKPRSAKQEYSIKYV